MEAQQVLRVVSSRAFSRVFRRSSHAFRLARRIGWLPSEERVRWFGARTIGEASRGLATNASHTLTASRSWILVVGLHRPLRASLERQFRRRGHPYRVVDSLESLDLTAQDVDSLACMVAAEIDASAITELSRRALADPRFRNVAFEYASGLESEQQQFRAQDEYAEHSFISPVLLADPSPYALYDASLRHFEQKTGLRDYLDLYQLLVSVEERRVPGEIAEFGSYRGHSGWLISRTLDALGSRRRLYMFDAFDTFPEESAGVDHFWSGTHPVTLEEVRAKFSGLGRVELVPGEFERTLPQSALGQIALAYVDCDSYRAVAYLARALFEDRLSPGGVMVFEDYGHPALLGCRVAVHEYFDGRGDCLRFFSQFSGLYTVIKLPAPTAEAAL